MTNCSHCAECLIGPLVPDNEKELYVGENFWHYTEFAVAGIAEGVAYKRCGFCHYAWTDLDGRTKNGKGAQLVVDQINAEMDEMLALPESVVRNGSDCE